MKKRTLVCFLIFTLCVFYTAIPNAVFGQEEEASLADQVIENHGDTLKRPEIQGGFSLVLGALQANPAAANLLNAGTIEIVIETPSFLNTLINPDTLTEEQKAALDQFVPLLAAKDEDVLELLRDPQVLEALKDPAAVNALAAWLDALPDDGTTPPDDGTTPPDDGTTPPDDGTTPPDDGTTPPDDGTTPPDDGTTPPPPVDMVDMAEPYAPVMPTNASILGKSRLGGLSMNPASGKQFIEELIAETGIPVGAEQLVEIIVDAIPDGFLPKRQIRGILLSERLAAFAHEAPQLDAENFGNAMTPNFTDFLYNDFGEVRNQKYLTSDSLHLYTRVPAKVAGVEFALSNGTTKQGKEVTMAEFQADTYEYTFRLEETLAATNLPAWPDLKTQLFSDVRLRWATELDAPIYEADTMTAVTQPDGTTVWEFKADIPADRGSTYYYFEVTLAEPVHFRTLDRQAIVDLDRETVTLDAIFDEVNRHVYTIDRWVMPDPRNLQFADRGIVERLLTQDFQVAMREILLSPQGIELISKAFQGEVDLSVLTQEQWNRILNIVERNARDLTTYFETEFDPLLASVFSVPKNIDLETQSLWVAHFDASDFGSDGNFQVKADVLDADRNVLDRIQENVSVDTSAPEADISISPSGTAISYWNDEKDIYYATAPADDSAATLNVEGIPEDATDIGAGIGYLFYQMIGLDENGNPNPNITPNTWEPLTVENTMLASAIWNAVINQLTDEQIASTLKPLAGQLGLNISILDDAQIAGIVRAQTLPGLLSAYLTAGNIHGPINMFLSSLGVGEAGLLTAAQTQLIVDLIGGTVDIINELIPVTFNPSDSVTMPIQGQEMPLLIGNYGIRAMGIDSLFNVGAYVQPTHLSIVGSTDSAQMNTASVVLANIGDRNADGLDPRYEHGTIYANTKEGVVLTVRIDEDPHFLAGIAVEYQDANGNWQPIGMLSEADLEGAQPGSEYMVTWDVPDAVFDTVGPDGFGQVMVRAVATNKLQITDADAMPFSIDLDAGIYPPEVLELAVDETSIMSRNQDSDAPQGMVTINATTLPQTGPRTVSVRFEAKREKDTDWMTIGTATQGNDAGIVDAVTEAVGVAVEGNEAPINTGGNLTWSINVDTTTLEDTITKDSPGARDASKDDNQYTIRALAVTQDGTEWPIDPAAAESTMLSVDNIDDVEPLGPTNITAIANADGAVAADPDGGYTFRGLLDENDPSVMPQILKLTIEPTAERKTYESVMLVSDPAIDAALVGAPVETSEGVFEITVNIGDLGIAGNGAYTIHVLAYDASPDGPDEMYGNVQTDESPESTVHVKNYLRPDPAVFQITKDLGTEMNADSEGPQGTFMFTGHTVEQNSPPIESVRLEAKRANDTEWTTIGTADTSTAVDIGGAALPSALDHLVGVADEGTTAGNRSVVAIGESYNAWTVTVDTRALGLEDSITKDSPGARDVSMDDNPYTVRAFAVDASGKEWPSDATEMFSLDNVDDVAPLGPTNVSVTDVMATENSVFEDAGDGSYTVGGLVDKHDAAVNSPVATFTVEPTAVRKTYQSIRFVPGVEGLVITDVVETAEGSGVFTLTVDVGTLADGETYLANGTYMFYALAFDEFGNEQDDMSETDGSKISVTVSNTRRPVPQALAFTVGDPAETSPDSGAPRGTITLYGYTPEITSAPTTSVMFEVKRKNDTEWTKVGTASESSPVTAADDAKLAAADVADVADVVGGNVVKSDTYQRWMIEVDTTTLEDSIDKDNPGARDHTKDDNMYMVRATASATADGSANLSADDVTTMFSVDNVDDVAPLEPTNIVVTSVDGVDTVFETADDGSFTVGGLVDKYDIDGVPSPVATFTIKPIAERHTYKSVKLAMYPEGALVGDVSETEEGSGVFTVTVDIGILADRETYLENGTYTFQALAYDGVMDVVDSEFGNVEAGSDGSKVSVTVENSYRPAPEVLALSVDPESITETNPDSGAPQGTITIHAYSHEISSPFTTAVRLEVKRPGDAEWIDVGTATTSVPTTEVSDAALTEVVGYLANEAASATEAGTEETVVSVSQTYQMWAIDVDTTALEDTITADSPAARDASKDENQYMVRAIPIEAAEDYADPEASPNATEMFSVDNVDDVEPHGPTHIIDVADHAGTLAKNEDGSYTFSNIVDDTLPSPMAIFTIEQDAKVDPMTYEGGSVNLVQTIADGTQTTTEGAAGVLDTITIDVGTHANGTYMFHALTVDKFGNVQTEDSPQITVHVLNFRVSDVTDLAVIAVDGADVSEPPAEPISLRNSVTVSFMVANGSLADEELTGAVNGQGMPNESEEDPENTFSLMVEVGSLVDGVYTPDAVVTKRNRSVAFPITTVNVDNTGPVVIIESPTDGEAVESLPTFHASYHDNGAGVKGAGVDGETGSLALARLQPPDAVDVEVVQEELAKDASSLVYTRTERLAGGAYRVTVEVTDILGNVGSGSQEFVVNGTLPTVAIHTPTSGQTFEHGEPLISGEITGVVDVEVTTFTINDVDAEPEVEGSQFSYTPEEALTNGDYKVVVEVTDADGNTAQTTTTFVVDIPEPPKDTTPPVISAVAPNGVIKDSDPAKLGAVVISAVVTDEQSTVTSVRYSVNGGQVQSISNLHIDEGKIQAPVDYEAHGDGLYTIRLIATSEGGTTEITWTFTLLVDNVKPTITSITPSGVVRGGLPVISASANDESGVAEMSIVVMDSDGEEVSGETQDDSEDNVSGITRIDFNPETPLEEGVYTIEVRATDPYSNTSSSKGTFTIDFDTAAPIITMASPANNARLMYNEGEERQPTISISYADAESGIDVDSIRFVFNDQLITLTPQQKSASQVTYKPAQDLEPGQYAVKLEVSDRANQEGNVSDESDGAREANMAVYQFTFSVELRDGPILAARPLNYPNPFKDNTRISFTLARQATVSIVIYDATLRPVRVLVDNQVFDAGNYTRKDNGSDAIGWDGKSSSGEDLARGIYFCEIIVADGFEPEYAILKLALTR